MLKIEAVLANLLTRNLLRGATDRRSCENHSVFAKPAPGMSVEDEKQKFLNMSLEEKIKRHPIKVTTMDQVPSWYDYWQKNKASIDKTKAEDEEKVDESLAKKVSIWEGSITSLDVGAIVNAANSRLMGGGGVDGAIHQAAGPSLKKECATLGGCQVGEAKITGGYQLPARYIIHTVGPQGEKPEKLRQCYENSLALAAKNDLRTIAFPCISTGIYGYPPEPAAKVALTTVKKFLEDNPNKIDKVIFCCFLKSDVCIYLTLMKKYLALD